MTDQTTIDDDLSRGFSDGNYQNSYVTEDFRLSVEGLNEPTPAYLAAYTLGFFGTYELHEMGYHAEVYSQALASEYGQRCIELGYCEADEGAES